VSAKGDCVDTIIEGLADVGNVVFVEVLLNVIHRNIDCPGLVSRGDIEGGTGVPPVVFVLKVDCE
jgi:hypothetical protein